MPKAVERRLKAQTQTAKIAHLKHRFVLGSLKDHYVTDIARKHVLSIQLYAVDPQLHVYLTFVFPVKGKLH